LSYRTVVIKNRAKIETRLNWLVIRGEEEKLVHLSEIGTLIVESTGCAITTQALCQLVKNNTSIIFCDEKHMPHSQLSPLYGNHLTSGNVKRQARWAEERKALAWQEIVKQKIYWQAQLLDRHNKSDSAKLLYDYICNVKEGDITNREGHSAKVYFNALFGQGFGRRTDNEINSALNYGYAILLSSVAREIVGAGYITQIGIHHINEFNYYNLASDIMEVFRPIVDTYVLNISDYENFKSKVTAVLTAKAEIFGKEQFLDATVRIYVRAVLHFMEGEGEMPKLDKIHMFLPEES